jgi:hypothetical protein
MPVTVLAEDVELRDGDNIVVVNEYDYPIVLEESGRYIGIKSDGEYNIFEKGTVKRIINPTSCVATPKKCEKPHSVNAEEGRSNASPVEIEVESLEKPVGSVVRTLMSEYSTIHGNTQEI